jgi:hypothetical protein
MSEPAPASVPGRALGLALLAWLVPAAGHLALRRTGRAAVFAAVVAVALVVGVRLDGNLYRPVPGQPLSYLATLGSMGAGGPYFFLRYSLGYQGDATAGGYEYGTAFLLSAGLMNLLLVLDVWDIARQRKP